MTQPSIYEINLQTIDQICEVQVSNKPALVPETQVLIYEREKKQIRQIYLIPVFTRLLINRISSIDMYSNEGVVGARFFMTIRYGGIPEKYIVPLLNSIVLILNDAEHLSFAMNADRQFESYQNHEEKTATYIRTMKIPGSLDAKIFLAPFQRLYLSIAISILPYFVEQKDPETGKITIVGFRFNQMMNNDIGKMFNVSKKQECLNNGEYALARSRNYLNVSISDADGNQEVNSTYQEDIMNPSGSDSDSAKNYETKFRQANVISFQCMFYRLPSVAITTIFIPLWVMGFITICIFTMSQNVDSRITFAATIYVSFAAYFQVIRSALPKSPNISMMEIIVYAIISICVLGVIRTLNLINYHEYNIWYDPYFIVSGALLIGSILIIIGGFIIYKLILEPQYYSSDNSSKVSAKIIVDEWQNIEVRDALYDFKFDICFAQTRKGITSPNLNLANGNNLNNPNIIDVCQTV